MRADRYRVVVLGTRFGVAVASDRRVDVDVDEGVVEVWSSDVRLAHLEPGQRWNSAVSADKASEAETAADPADKAAEMQTETPELPAAAPAEKLVPSPGMKIGRPEARRRQSAHGAARVAMVATPARSTVESPGAARAALAAGDAPRALEIYRNLAQKTGPVAENAAYEIGRILNERGQSSAAVAAWRRYRSDYPNGILRVEADVSIIETLARAGDTDDALTEATEFLRRRPDSERRGEIARVAGDLYRARGDCRHAVGAYQVALSASRARDITEAAGFHRAACLVATGQQRCRCAAQLPPLLSRRPLQAPGDRADRTGPGQPLAEQRDAGPSSASRLALSLAACRQTIVLDQQVDGGAGGVAAAVDGSSPTDRRSHPVPRGHRRARSVLRDEHPLRRHHARPRSLPSCSRASLSNLGSLRLRRFPARQLGGSDGYGCCAGQVAPPADYFAFKYAANFCDSPTSGCIPSTSALRLRR